MWQLARALGEIATGRRGPESLPDSIFLLGLLLGVHIVVYFVDMVVVDMLRPAGLANMLVQEALLLAYVYAVLSFFRLERRFRQTVSALLGVDIILYLIFFPFALAGFGAGADIESQWFGILRVTLILWSIAIGGWILARALSQPFILGFMFQILLLIASITVAGFFLQPAD